MGHAQLVARDADRRVAAGLVDAAAAALAISASTLCRPTTGGATATTEPASIAHATACVTLAALAATAATAITALAAALPARPVYATRCAAT